MRCRLFGSYPIFVNDVCSSFAVANPPRRADASTPVPTLAAGNGWMAGRNTDRDRDRSTPDFRGNFRFSSSCLSARPVPANDPAIRREAFQQTKHSVNDGFLVEEEAGRHHHLAQAFSSSLSFDLDIGLVPREDAGRCCRRLKTFPYLERSQTTMGMEFPLTALRADDSYCIECGGRSICVFPPKGGLLGACHETVGGDSVNEISIGMGKAQSPAAALLLSPSPRADAMKVAVMSDLHLEYDARHVDKGDHGAKMNSARDFYFKPPQPEADLLVLAGDVHGGALAIDWAIHHFSLPILLIGGNHECYGHELFRTIAFNRQRANTTNGRLVFLERATWQVQLRTGERARFICATLWTDFWLYGTPEVSMAIAQQRLEDFNVIRIERGYKLRKLQPSDTARLHRASVAFLRKELDQPFDGVTVVVTHHAPSPRSIAAKFHNDPLNPAFVSNLDALICNYEPALWIHGHMHDSFDYMIGRTRVICNPRGYFPDQLNPRFDPSLVVDVQPLPGRADHGRSESARQSLPRHEVIDGFGGTADPRKSRGGWSSPNRRNG